MLPSGNEMAEHRDSAGVADIDGIRAERREGLGGTTAC